MSGRHVIQVICKQDRQPFVTQEVLMLKSIIKQHPVASFFVLSYAISWVFWAPAVLYIKLVLPTDQVPGWLMIPNLVGSWGPFFAALAMTGILEGKPGVKKLLARLLVWRVGFLWYLIVFLLPLVILFAALGIFALQGGALGRFDPGQWYAVLLAPVFALLLALWEKSWAGAATHCPGCNAKPVRSGVA